MLLPYASDRPAARTPLTVVLLVLFHFAVMGLVWLVTAVRGPDDPTRGINMATAWYTNLAFVPALPHVWSCLSYSILHSDVFHLSVNMLFLWVFGGSVEDALGWKRFLGLYVLAAAVTGWVQVGMVRLLPGTDWSMPIVGSSGAISAIVGVFAVRFYRAKVRVVGLPSGVSAVALLAVVMLAEMGSVVYHLVGPGAGLGQTTAQWAHLAGFVIGLGAAFAGRQSQAGREDYRLEDAAKELEEGGALAAVHRWEGILRERPDDPEVEGELARAWAQADDREQALEHYGKSIAGFLARGDRPAAGERAARMFEAYQDATLEPDEWFTCARALDDGGKAQAAADAYRRLHEAHSDHERTEMILARLAEIRLKKLGDAAAAVEALEKLLEVAPTTDLRGYAQALLAEARAKCENPGAPDGA